MGWGADGGSMLAQYGTHYGGPFGHDCEFSGSGTISVEDLDNFDQEKFAKQCQRCGLKDTCSATAYEWVHRGSSRWILLYSASTLGGKGACDMLVNNYRSPALGELAESEDVILSGRHCGDETLGHGSFGCPPSCGLDYRGILVAISSEQREELQKFCDQYKSAKKNPITACWTATGIPSSAYSSSYSNTFGLDGNVYGSVPSSSSDCQVSIRVSGAKVWGVLLKKWTCVKNYDAGQPLFD